MSLPKYCRLKDHNQRQTLPLLNFLSLIGVLTCVRLYCKNFYSFFVYYSVFKPGFHITIMVQVVESQAGYDYGACVLSQVPQVEFNLVCGTAGTVQSEESNLMNLS